MKFAGPLTLVRWRPSEQHSQSNGWTTEDECDTYHQMCRGDIWCERMTVEFHSGFLYLTVDARDCFCRLRGTTAALTTTWRSETAPWRPALWLVDSVATTNPRMCAPPHTHCGWSLSPTGRLTRPALLLTFSKVCVGWLCFPTCFFLTKAFFMCVKMSSDVCVFQRRTSVPSQTMVDVNRGV